MNFILKMAWRDSRASRRRLMLFSLSIVVGISALVMIGSLTANLRTAVEENTKGLLGADLMLSSRGPLSVPVKKYIDALGAEQAHDLGFSSMMVFPTADNLTRLVQVRAGEGNFPFYGDFITVPADAPQKLRAGGNVVILEESVLVQFNAKVGDTVKLGKTTFTIIGALKEIAGESSAVAATFAPRAMIPMSALSDTGLAGTGKESLVQHRLMLKLPATRTADSVEREMRGKFPEERINYADAEERKRNLGRAIDNAEGFLSLVGFVAVFLGAIGVASAVHVYVRQKITTVAILRCLGASAGQSFSVYVLQGFALGVFGAVAGALIGVAGQYVLPALLFKGTLPMQVKVVLEWPAIGRGVVSGLVICVLFTLLPLLSIRRVSPLVALRSAFIEKVGSAFDPLRLLLGFVIVAAVATFAIWQTKDVRIGTGFAVVLLAGFAILWGVAKLVTWLAKRFTVRSLPYVVRQGLANLHRPNNRTALLLLSLGLGTFLILTLFLARTTLLREVEGVSGAGRANLLFFDIQDDQMETVKRVAAEQGSPVLVYAPIVTMKISAVRGVPVEDLLKENTGTKARINERKRKEKSADAPEAVAAWALRREYRSSFRAELGSSEQVTSGKWIGHASLGDAVVPISLEESLVKDMAIKLGDEITWDVQGLPMRTKVASIRKVEWRRMEPNFFVLFPEGVLEGAPKFYVAALRAATPADSAKVQRAIVAATPNVSAIDLAIVLQSIDRIISKVSFGIQLTALSTVITGIIVLAGAILTGRYQRIRETVLLRTLGATSQQLNRIQFVEYAVLGVLAAFVGMLLAMGGNWLLAHYVFHITPVAPPLLLGGTVVLMSAITLITGALANRGVTNHPPLEVLRNET